MERIVRLCLAKTWKKVLKTDFTKVHGDIVNIEMNTINQLLNDQSDVMQVQGCVRLQNF